MDFAPIKKGIYPLLCALLLSACAPDTTNSTSTPPLAADAGSSQPPPVERDDRHTAVEVLDISERDLDGGPALAVTFSTPLAASDDFSRHLLVTDQHHGLQSGRWVLSESGKIAYFPHIEPASRYQIQVLAGLAAANGKQLTDSHTATVDTRDIRAAVSFANRGNFLPLDHHRGLPVVTVNVPAVDINFHRVKDDKLLTFLRRLPSGDNITSLWNAQQLASLSELVHSARYQLDPPANKRHTVNLPIQDLDALGEPGVYLAIMQVPGAYQGRLQATYFAVTDLGMHLRLYKDSIDVHLSSLSSGDPIAGAELTLIGGGRHNNNAVVATTRSTPQGYASLKRHPDTALLIARQGKSMSLLALNRPALDLSEFDLGKRPQRPQELFIYSPRDLYRPGETVQFSALLRDGDGRLDSAPALKVKILTADDQLAREFTWSPGAANYYSYQYRIPRSAKTGNWTLQVTGADQKPYEYRFKVEDFLPERMTLNFNPQRHPAAFHPPEAPIAVQILGEYLYGAPASGNRLEASAKITAARTPLPQLPEFQFGDSLEKLPPKISLPDLILDPAGRGTLQIDSHWRGARSPLQLQITGNLYETGGRPVSRRHREIIWPSSALIGIRPDFGDQNPTQNSTAYFDLVIANAQGQQLAADRLQVTLIREDRRYFWEYSDHGGWRRRYTDRHYPEYTTALSIAAGDTGRIGVPVEWGGYRLEVRDPERNTLSSLRFHAGPDWYSNWARNQSASQAARPDQVSLALDKAAYRAGDRAQLTITPPAAGKAIVMVESDRKLWEQHVDVPADGLQLQIPISEVWNRHDLYISVLHLQPSKQRDKITAKRSLGLLHLPLDRTPRKLQLEFEVPETSVPNRTLPIKIAVSDHRGQPPADTTWLTLAAVDVGVLNITDFETPTPHNHFFEQRRYQVDSHDIYQRLIEANDNPLARQRWGGDGELSRGGKEARADVQIVSLFNGPVTLDDSGQVEIPLALPDFNGRLRLMAVAFSDSHFGSADRELTVAAPVVTQIAMPRFIAPGDKSVISLDVQNLTDQPQTLDIQLTTTGSVAVVDNGSLPAALTLQPDQKVHRRYLISADYPVMDSKVRLAVNGVEGYPIERSWNLALRPPYPADLRTKRTALNAGESLRITPAELKDLYPATLEANISASNNIDLGLREQLNWLLHYPYGCLEQTTSTAWPWLYMDADTIAKYNITLPPNTNRVSSIQRAMDNLSSHQLFNGGFGLWGNQSPESKWLTAYATDFMTHARDQGFAVSDQVFQKATKRLSDYLRKRDGHHVQRHTSSPWHYQAAYRAYAGYVLSKLQRAPLGNLRTLAREFNSRESHSKLPLIHLGLAMINQGDQRGGQKLIEKAIGTAYVDGYYGDYGSEIRDLSQAIFLLLSNDRDGALQKLAGQLSVELAGLQRKRRYFSTQERNALFQVAHQLSETSGPTWTADLEFGSETRSIERGSALLRTLTNPQVNDGFGITNTGDDTLFATLNYQGYPKTPPKPYSDADLSIERYYYDRSGNPISPSRLTVGELVLVQLTITSKQRRPDLLVVDMLPAGLELENQNLEHAFKLESLTLNNIPATALVKNNNVLHQEYRDDRYICALELQGTANLLYLARAVTPGIYQVPPPLVEDMYQPEARATGTSIEPIAIDASN